MNTLAQQVCEPCSKGSIALNTQELNTVLQELANWCVVTHTLNLRPPHENHPPKLARTFTFNNFINAMAFAQQISNLAEQFNHHPTLTVEYGLVSVYWWTHKINNIHQTDAIMAAKTEVIYNTLTTPTQGT